MKDGRGRRTVKRLGLAVYRARVALHRRNARRLGEIRYELAGGCIRSGQCCEAPGIRVGKLTFYVPLARRVFLWWHEHVNRFVLQEIHRGSRVFYFRCMHYDRGSRSCDSYDSRPGMCRDYPLLLTEQANPEPFALCGYKLLDVKRKEMLDALESRGVSREQMQKLKKGLYLE